MELIKTGATRWVFLIGKYAIKFPSLYSWRLFLRGLLGNDQEVQWGRSFQWTKKLCPIFWTCFGRFIVIMPRVKVMTPKEFSELKESIAYYAWLDGVEEDKMPPMPCELKADSFGWLNGRLVIIDYGS